MSQSVKLRLERMAKSQLDVSEDSRLSGKGRKKVLLGCSAPPGGPPSVARRRRTPAAHRPARAGHLGFALFGHPAPTEPWGWQLWGHHLDVLCFILGRQMVLTPTFMGAEPSAADRGSHKGRLLFDQQREAGLELRRSLRSEQASHCPAESMLTWDLPDDLTDPVDGRHNAGAGRDNLVIPYAGLPAENLSPTQQELLIRLVGTYVYRMPSPPPPRCSRMSNTISTTPTSPGSVEPATTTPSTTGSTAPFS